MNLEEVMVELNTLANIQFSDNLIRFGINNTTALGIRIPELRLLAKRIKKNHELALRLWNTNIHEARLLAIFIADVKLFKISDIEDWLQDFNSWDICDQFCGIIYKHPSAYLFVNDWCNRNAEFEKRAGFSLIATLAVHDKKADDLQFIQLFPLIIAASNDERNFVKKAVNWALRQIGKRNDNLKKLAIQTAESIKQLDSKAAKWIANDALRELIKL